MLDAALMFVATVLLFSERPSGWVRRVGVTLLLGAVLFREQTSVCLLGLPVFAATVVLLAAANVLPLYLEAREHKNVETSKPTDKVKHLACLSQREREVIALLLSGKSQSEAAAELGLKPSTVGTYRQRVMEKLSIASLDELGDALPDDAKSDRIAAAHWTPMIWAATAVAILICRFGGLRACSLVAMFAAAFCILAIGCSKGEGANFASAVIAVVLGLALGVVLRGVAVGSLSALCGFVVLAATMGAAGILRRLGILASPERFPKSLAAGVPMFVLGLCVGPSSPEVVNVEFAGLSLNWPLTLVMAISLAVLAAVLETCLLSDESLSLDLGSDEDRALHVLQGRGLSELEASVLLAIARGEKPSKIAERLCIARGTVNSCRLRGYRKLGIHSRQELVDLLNVGME